MKDARFKELLNLYLDNRLAPDEAHELEAEVLRNPSRRRAYDAYCRMQRACSILFESERRGAPASFALARALRTVEQKLAAPHEAVTRPVRTGWLGWAGGIAAGCALAISITVFIQREEPVASPSAAGEIGAARRAPEALAAVDPAPAIPRESLPVQLAAFSASAAFAPAHLAKAGTASPNWASLIAAMDPVNQSRLAAQRWIDAEAAAMDVENTTKKAHFELQPPGSSLGALPDFQSRPAMTNAVHSELTSYQFQR